MTLFGARYPLVQAPMAGVQPPSLAAHVSNAGGLGTIAGALLTPDELRGAILEVRASTDAPFGVNLFAPPYLREGALDVVLEERPAVLGLTFGLLDPAPFQEAGIAVLATATTVEEAAALEAAGVDAIVAQGVEAGGHRGTFLGSFEDAMIPLDELVRAIDVSTPLVAAGGIVDGFAIRRVLDLGAMGAQLGTAFLFTPECGRPRAHLDALRTYDTVVTPAYTGRHMRAARTPLLEELMAAPTILPFPEQRAVSAERGPVFMGGTGARDARELPAADLVAALVREARL